MPQEFSSDDRLSRIEARLASLESRGPKSSALPEYWERAVALALAVSATWVLYRGVGAPNHGYQWALGVLVILMAYHSRALFIPTRPYEFPIIVFNIAQAILILKLLIGGGIRHPFSWLQYPSLNFAETSERWYSLLPKTTFQWTPSTLTTITLDLTVVQSFCAVLTAFATLFRFQPFASLCGFLLILFSIPALIEFDWAYVFPGLMLAGASYYLQTVKRTP